jgi:hypothetical protein
VEVKKQIPDFRSIDDEDLLLWYTERLDWDVPGIQRALKAAHAEILRRMAADIKQAFSQ